jgi:hypothetical protein
MDSRPPLSQIGQARSPAVRAHWGLSVSASTPHPPGLMPPGHDPPGGDAGRANVYIPSSEKTRASPHMAMATMDVQTANVR